MLFQLVEPVLVTTIPTYRIQGNRLFYLLLLYMYYIQSLLITYLYIKLCVCMSPRHG